MIYGKLDELSKNYHIDHDGEIMVYESPEQESGLMLYDPYSKELAISPDIFSFLALFHGVEDVDNLNVIKDWFEKKFKVKVKEMYAWDW